MKAFVTGGTGAIGGYAVPAPVAAGHHVTALARSDAKAEVLRAQGATPVRVSLFDRADLDMVVAGHDVVVNLASALPPPAKFMFRSAWRDCERIRTAGSAAVADAALLAGVPRMIQESVVMIYRGAGDQWITEGAPVDHYPIAAGNHAAEASAGRFGSAGGAAVVLRFGLFYGPGAAHSEQIVELARRRIGFVGGHGDTYMSSIHLADASDAVVAALECPGGTYNIVDDQPVTKRENAVAIGDVVGVRPWLTVPGRAALLLGDRATSLTRSLRVSNGLFRATTPWRPRYPSVREGYRSFGNTLVR